MYSWYKIYHGACTDPKFALIERKTGIPRSEVWYVFSFLLDHASQQEDRGSVYGLDCDVVGVALNLPSDRVEQIIQAVRERGMIDDQDRLTAWDRRQNEKSTERVREHRRRVKGSVGETHETVEKCFMKQNETHETVSGTLLEQSETGLEQSETQIDREIDREIEREKRTLAIAKVTQPLDDWSIAGWQSFIAKYPNQTKVDTAARAWMSLIDLGEITAATVGEVLAGLDRWIASRSWAEENGKFIPSPSVFLMGSDKHSGRLWKDKPEPSAESIAERRGMKTSSTGTDAYSRWKPDWEDKGVA